MDAIKKKMQSLKSETENALGRAAQLEAEAKDANTRAEKTEEHVSLDTKRRNKRKKREKEKERTKDRERERVLYFDQRTGALTIALQVKIIFGAFAHLFTVFPIKEKRKEKREKGGNKCFKGGQLALVSYS